jgi:hypothetical protein
LRTLADRLGIRKGGRYDQLMKACSLTRAIFIAFLREENRGGRDAPPALSAHTGQRR